MLLTKFIHHKLEHKVDGSSWTTPAAQHGEACFLRKCARVKAPNSRCELFLWYLSPFVSFCCPDAHRDSVAETLRLTSWGIQQSFQAIQGKGKFVTIALQKHIYVQSSVSKETEVSPFPPASTERDRHNPLRVACFPHFHWTFVYTAQFW